MQPDAQRGACKALVYFVKSGLIFSIALVAWPLFAQTTSYTAAEVAQHGTTVSCWSIIDNNVYDLTAWRTQHPGGSARILSICGIDGSSAFHGEHGNNAQPAGILAGFKIGVLAASADTTAPTISSVSAASITSSGATISWSTNEASDTQVEYGVTTAYGSQTTLNTSLLTNHAVTLSGLNQNTTYNYRVKSKDAAGNLTTSGNFTLTTAAAADTTAPSIPASLVATAVSSSQINLSWNASTDSVGVMGYQVESCPGASCTNYIQIATPSGTSYSNTGLAASTAYRYRVRAVDAAGNLSGYSSVVTGTTPAPSPAVDTTAPSIPASLVATAVSSSQINLSWNASTDSVGVMGYHVFRCQGTSCTASTLIGSPTNTLYSDTGLLANTSYRYRVRAIDAAGNNSNYSSAVTRATSAVTPPADTTAPTISSVSAASITSSGATISWSTNEASDTQVEYGVTTAYGSQTTLNTSLLTNHAVTLSGLNQNTTYNYRVKSKDAAGNLTTSGNFTLTTAAAADTTAPTVSLTSPLNGATVVGSDVVFAATASDNVMVTGVQFLLNGANVGSEDVTAPYSVSWNSTSVSNDFYVISARARDAAGNVTNSSGVNLSVFNVTAPPQQGTYTAAEVAQHGTTVSCWSIIDNNVYDLTTWRTQHPGGSSVILAICGTNGTSAFHAQHGTASVPASILAGYKIGTLAASTEIDTTAPSTPAGLTASALSSSRINLSWNASTDSVGVTGYRVESCQGASCTNYTQIATPSGTSYSNTGLAASTAYRYRVRAVDAAGNLSGYSSAESGTTLGVQAGTYTAADVARNSSASSCWTIIDNKVYDLTSWINQHPGGQTVIRGLCGKDGTSAFHAQHGTAANPANILAGYKLGLLTGPSAEEVPGDTVSPTVPSNLTATVSSLSQVNLSWTASTDKVSGVEYKLYRCRGLTCTNYLEITKTTATTFSDTGLVQNNAYRYRVRAIDKADNVSAYSNVVTATVGQNVVTTPTTPTGLMLTTNLSRGDRGVEVLLLKLALLKAGFTSFVGVPTTIFDVETEKALERFQKANNISGSGRLTKTTRDLLNLKLSNPVTTPIYTGAAVFTMWLARNTTHPQVTLLQRLLISEGVYPEAVVSGYFGGLTELALKRFQSKYAIVTSGSPDTTGYGGVGPRTRVKLNELAGSIASVIPPPTTSAGPASGSTFTTIGGTVYTADRLSVRSGAMASGLLIGIQAKGSKGTVLEGPVTADGHTWWKIAFTAGFTGWSSQTWLSSTPVASTVVTPSVVTPPKAPVVSTPAPSRYTAVKVGEHSTPASCWTIIDNVVYDLTAWIPLHPGGESYIKSLCGTNGSSAFHGMHGTSAAPATALKAYRLGAVGS